MLLRPRVLVPIGLAVFCALLVGSALWWQLMTTQKLLAEQNTTAITTNGATGTPFALPAARTDAGDTALLQLRRGDLLALQGAWADAQVAYERSIAAGGGLLSLRKLAQTQLQRRDIRGARTTLEQLKIRGARAEDLLLLQSIIELRSGEIARARSFLENANDSPQKHYALSLLRIVEGDHARAQEALAQVIGGWEPVLRNYAQTLQNAYSEYALFPQSPNTHLITLLARALAQVQECELALPLLQQVIAQEDDYRDAWIVQGYCELMTERPQEALASFERAYALDPEKPEVQYFLARAFALLKDHKNAVTFLEYALRNGFTPEADARLLLAREAIESGDAVLALEQFSALTQAANAGIETYDGAVSAALALGKTEEASIKAAETLAKWPEEGLAHELTGLVAEAAGRVDDAKTAFRKALELDPSLARSREKLRE